MAGKHHRKSINTKSKIICEKCKMQIIEEEDDFIDCDKCAKKYHSQCTHLDKRQFEHLLNNESEMFICHMCKGGDEELKNELSAIKTKLNKLDQLTDIQEAIQFMSRQYDEILKGVAENKRKVHELEKENKTLKHEIANLKTSVKLLNNERVRNDCIVNGLIVEEGMTAVDSVIKLTKDVGVDINPSNIDDAFFIRNKTVSNQVGKGIKRSAIVKFSSKSAKDKLMSIKPKLKENETTRSVFVNDLLCKETLNLLNYARALKEVGYTYVYTRNGKVFYKRSQISRPQMISTEEDVDKLLITATSGKPWKRRSVVPDANADDPVTSDDDGEQAAYVSP